MRSNAHEVNVAVVMGDIQEGVDVVVIGAGPGGYVAAIRAAQLGREVHLVDSLDRLGGVCLNWGCIPSKALIHVANFFNDLGAAGDFGVNIEQSSLDSQKMQEWKEGIVDRLSKGIGQLCKDNGVTVHKGTAHFTSDKSLAIDSGDRLASYHFKNAIIATGSTEIEIPGLAFDDKKGIVSSRGALSWTEVPQRLVVVGGGYIGIELGTVFAKFGSQVTIVEALDRILTGMDPDIVKPVERKLKKLGVDVRLNAKAESFTDKKLMLEGGEMVEADKVLVAVGRKPNTASLELNSAGVELDEKGFIKTQPNGQTSCSHIYAIGDVAGGMLLAHKASAEGKVAAEAICGQAAALDSLVPAVIFSDPEIASIGLNEHEARTQGYQVETGQFPFAALGRAMAAHATDGFVKVVSDAQSRRLLGFQIVGGHASELIATATHALEMGALSDDLELVINTHPTFAEAIGEAVESIYGKAIHLSPRKQKRT